jgi:hypothetical protein
MIDAFKSPPRRVSAPATGQFRPRRGISSGAAVSGAGCHVAWNWAPGSFLCEVSDIIIISHFAWGPICISGTLPKSVNSDFSVSQLERPNTGFRYHAK